MRIYYKGFSFWRNRQGAPFSVQLIFPRNTCHEDPLQEQIAPGSLGLSSREPAPPRKHPFPGFRVSWETSPRNMRQLGPTKDSLSEPPGSALLRVANISQEHLPRRPSLLGEMGFQEQIAPGSHDFLIASSREPTPPRKHPFPGFEVLGICGNWDQCSLSNNVLKQMSSDLVGLATLV